MLAPGEFVEVPFKFTPREQKDFGFTVPFLVNGSSTVKCAVIGSGIPARLELANPSNVLLPFGAVPEGEDISKQLKVVNRSKKALTFELVDPMHLGRGRLEAQDIHRPGDAHHARPAGVGAGGGAVRAAEPPTPSANFSCARGARRSF